MAHLQYWWAHPHRRRGQRHRRGNHPQSRRGGLVSPGNPGAGNPEQRGVLCWPGGDSPHPDGWGGGVGGCPPSGIKYNEHTVRALQTVRQNVHLDLPDMVTLATDALKQAGVALVLEPATDKSWLRSATFWPRRNKAVLALATGTETADRLRFSLFHQIGHIMLHRDHHFLETSTTKDPLKMKQTDSPPP